METLGSAGYKHEDKHGNAEDFLYDGSDCSSPEGKIVITPRTYDPDVALLMTKGPAVASNHEGLVTKNRRKDDNKHRDPAPNTVFEKNTCHEAPNDKQP